jgi:general secretion pathway protein C
MLAFRFATGAAGLVALYLGTHALTGMVGLRVWDDVEPVAVVADADAADAAEKKPRSSSRSLATQDQEKRDKLVEQVTEYNPFCPGCVETPELPEGVDGEEGVGLMHPGEVETDLPLVLVATMEALDPTHSLATISQSDGVTGLYAEGDAVVAGVEIVGIETGIVHMRNGARYEYLSLQSGDKPKPKPKKPVPKKPGDDKPSPHEIEGASDAIKCNGMSCTVDRGLITKLMANPALLAKQGNARPYSRSGLEGFRLSHVRKGTLPNLLGMRTGDVVTSINGQSLESVDGAMAMYTKLRSASHLSIGFTRSVSRQRKEFNLEIDIE